MGDKTFPDFDEETGCFGPGVVAEGTRTYLESRGAMDLLRSAYAGALRKDADYIRHVDILRTLIEDVYSNEKELYELWVWLGRRLGVKS